jgi:hypothetical protein
MCVIAIAIGLATHSTVPHGVEMANPQDTASRHAQSSPCRTMPGQFASFPRQASFFRAASVYSVGVDKDKETLEILKNFG